MRLEPMNAADIDVVANLVLRCDFTIAGWEPPPDHAAYERHERETWRRILGRDEWTRVVRDPGPVAVVSFRPATNEDDGRIPGTAHLGALFVDPDRHGQGIGSRLLAAAEDEMRSREYESARLHVAVGAAARGFYERHGWNATGRHYFHEAIGLETLEYVKRLVGRRDGP